jgi:RHH-type transcriptional regulator, rel operon repressor / antitoxin RelB
LRDGDIIAQRFSAGKAELLIGSPFRGGTLATMALMINLPKSMEIRLGIAAERSGRTMTQLVTDAILQYVEDEEDVFEAERILRSVRSGRQQTFTLGEVAKKLGLED